MPKPLVMIISHELGREEAKRRLQKSVGQIRAQLAPFTTALDHQWTDDRLSFHMIALGQRVAGHIDVLDDSVRLELQLPGVLGWIGERISRRIQKQAALMLEKPKRPAVE
jgi:hypothetical protein